MVCDECELLKSQGGGGTPHQFLSYVSRKKLPLFARPPTVMTTYRCSKCQTVWIHTDDRDEKTSNWAIQSLAQ